MAAKFTPPAGFRPPMLCKTTLRDDLDVCGKWVGYIAEAKHDGVRCLVMSDAAGVVRLYSRTGQDFTEHVPALAAELSAWMAPDSIIDGELAMLRGAVEVMGQQVPVTDFSATMRVLGSLPARGRAVQDELGVTMSLVAYDLLRWDGGDRTEDAQDTRSAELADRIPVSELLVLNPQFGDHTRFGELFDDLVSHGIEGIITKNAEAPYAFAVRANRTWFKVKAATTMDMVVSGFTDGTGKFSGLIGAIEFARMGDDGELVHVGKCSGMTDEVRRAVTADPDAYLGRVIEVKSNELVGSKRYRSPRHPQFVAFRFDKNPQDCDGRELLNKEDDR